MSGYDEYEDDFYGPGMDASELAAALRGDYGPDVQAEALQAVGLEFQQGEEEWTPETEAWGRQFLAESKKLEKRLGRELTEAEWDTLFEHHQESETLPKELDYEEVIGRNIRHKDDRVAIGAEVMDEIDAQQEAEAQEGAEV